YIKAIAEARIINEHLSTLPSERLVSLNADPALDEPFAGADMYATGRNTSQFKSNFLPLYLWKDINHAMVYLFKYDNGGKDLQFVSPQVFLNRFNWSELSTQHPNYRDVTF
ncbi:MAG: hypothetical protein CEN92_73, partial [Candidatus Berkelbacteria bacterium Licking1014_96]